MRGHQWSCMGIRQLAVPGDIPARSRSESRVQGRLAAAGNIECRSMAAYQQVGVRAYDPFHQSIYSLLLAPSAIVSRIISWETPEFFFLSKLD
jgi:hypothetical protein